MTHLLDQTGPGDGAAQVQTIAASPEPYCNRVLPGARLRGSKSQGGPDHRTGKRPEGEWERRVAADRLRPYKKRSRDSAVTAQLAREGIHENTPCCRLGAGSAPRLARSGSGSR